MTAHLSFQGVTVGYVEGKPLLSDVSFDVERGEVAAVVSLDATGGKSTLVRVAGGLHQPWSGTVRFDGHDVYAMGFGADQRFRARCATVLEGGALLVNLSVRDNVALPLRYHHSLSGRELDARVDKLLDQAGFTEESRAFPWQVSVRGRRQAAFARALAMDPELVIIDRFFEGLEMPDWKRLFEVVLEMNTAQGTTWLLVSEVDPSIFQVAERVAVLEHGRLLDYGHRRRLYEDPRVRGAFEAAEDRFAKGARLSARYGPRPESERILIVEDTDEELSVLGASSDEDLGDAESTIVIDGVIPGSGRRAAVPDYGDAETTAIIDGIVPPAGGFRRPAEEDSAHQETINIPPEERP